MAESNYRQVSPYNLNSTISTLTSVYLMANIPNVLVLEYINDEQDAPWRNDLLTDPPQVEISIGGGRRG